MNLELKQITKQRGSSLVLDRIDYQFSRNGLFLLTGVNGSGKTTLLNIIGGRDSRYEGEIILDGVKIDDGNRNVYAEDKISYLTQDSLIFNDLSVLDNLLLPFSKKDVKKACFILEKLGLKNSIKQNASSLSGGEKQRLSFARIMYSPKEIILIDEITAHLDDDSATILYSEILELEKKHVVIFVTHDQRFIQSDIATILRIENHVMHLVKDSVLQEGDIQSEETKKQDSLRNEILSSFSFEKKSHLVFSIFVGLLSFLMVFFGSLNYSFKSTGNGFDGNKYFQKTNEIFSLTSNYLPGTSDYPFEGPSYHLLSDSLIQVGNDYSDNTAGHFISGIFAYEEEIEVELVNGRKPENEKECLVSNLCFSNLSSLNLGDSYLFMNKSYTVVGVYQADDAASLDSRYQGKESFNSLPRICYGFMIESLFVMDPDISSSIYLYESNEVNRKVFASQPSYLTQEDEDVVNVDSKGNNILHFFSFSESFYMFFLASIVALSLFLVLFVISFFVRNRRKYLLLRFMGYSRRKLTTLNLFSFGLNCLVFMAVGLAFSGVVCLIMNLVYSQRLGCPIQLFEFDSLSLAILAVAFLAFVILFGLILFKGLSKKDISDDLDEVKEK